jgi:hypothetical protein
MNFHEANLSLQLMAEERVGQVMRSHAEMLRAQEDAAYGSLAAQMGGREQ